MAQSSRTFRIFVSSTFSDLKAERNALQERVFPRLRDLAAAHGCRFQAIDLRWGVSEEAALDQQTMKICLGEIERCQKTSPRPNFIVLLGERYGWRPLPSEIPTDEFEKVIPLITGGEKSLLEQWYRRDDNAVPPVYLLQPRGDEFVDNENWEKVETKLRPIFLSAVGQLSLSPDALLKYSASATEQEIVAGALKIPDANEHVFCFLRGIQGLHNNARCSAFRESDPQAARQQSLLKDRLRQKLAGNVHEYSAHWQGDGPSMDHLDRLCQDVYAELSKVILAEVGLIETVEPLGREISAHEVFEKDRAFVFMGRAELLNSIEKYMTGNDPHPLAIWGASGCGKSALMAKAVEKAQQLGCDVIYRFIGTTPDSSNGRALLESLCRQISQTSLHSGARGPAVSSEYKDLVREFLDRLASARPGRPLVLFLDALDQLLDTDDARSLSWLPADLPSNVHLVVSTLPGECLQALNNKLPEQNRLEVQPMSVEEGKAILEAWLAGAHRTLQAHQAQYLLGRFRDYGLPLYLKLAFEEARLWGSYDDLPELSNDIPGILRDLFKRLSFESNHGSMLVSRSLGYIAAAKNGLSEDELIDVLSADQEVRVDFQRRSPKSPKSDRLPVVVWSRLYFDLEPYLTERSADGGSLLGFYHRQMSEACQAAYRNAARHKALATYFSQQPFYLEKNDQAPNLRKLSELPYQQMQAGLWMDLRNTLSDFDFLETKCSNVSVYDLWDDYRIGLDCWSGEQKDKDVLSAFQERLQLESHILHRDPHLLFPDFYNHLTWLDAPNGPIHAICEKEKLKHHAWLRMTQDPRPEPPLSNSSLEGHTGEINTVAVTPDGTQFVSGSSDRTIKIWDLQSGRLLHSLEGHTSEVFAVTVTPDSKQVVSGSGDSHSSTTPDNTLKVWDIHSGRLLRSLEGHTDRVDAVAVTPDGAQVVSGSWDKTIKVWDLQHGRLLHSLEGHYQNVIAVAVTPDGAQIVSGSRDRTILVWDLKTGRPLRSLEGHKGGVSAITVTPDGKQIVSSGLWDKTIKVWDLASGSLLRSLEGHRYSVQVLAVTPDGGQVVFGPDDDNLEVWDLASGRLLRSLKGAGGVNALVVTPDGTQIVCGRSDTLNIWDFASGRLLRSLEGQKDAVTAVAVTPDGSQIVSGSGGTAKISGTDDTFKFRDIKVWDLASGSLLRSLKGHKDWVNAVAVTPDGTQIVSGSDDKTLKVWDLATGSLLRSLEGHPDAVAALAVTPDGTQILSGSGIAINFSESSDQGNAIKACDIKVWDLASGRLLRSLEGHTDAVEALAITLDGAQVVSGSRDKTVKVWNIQSGRLLHSLEGHTDAVEAVAITPGGTQIVSGSIDNTIKVWDLASGRLLRSLDGTSAVTAVAVSSDGAQIVSASGATIKLWDFASGQFLQSLEGHKSSVESMALTPDGRQVVSGSSDKTIRVWGLRQNSQLLRSLEGHTSRVFALALTANGTQIVSGSSDNTLKVWDAASGRLHCSMEGHTDAVNAVAVTPDGTRVVSGSGRFSPFGHDDTVKIGDMQTGRLLHSLEGHKAQVYAVAVTPDGALAVSGSGDKTIKVWDIQSGRLLYSLEGHTDGVNAVAVTPDGAQVVSGSDDRTIKVWDLQSGHLLYSMTGDAGYVSTITVTPDGAQVISGSGEVHFQHSNKLFDYTLKVWDLRSGRLLHSLPGHNDLVNAVAVTPDGAQVFSGSNDRTIRVWDFGSNKNKVLFHNSSPILSIATNGHLLTCGDQEGHVWIFEWVK